MWKCEGTTFKQFEAKNFEAIPRPGCKELVVKIKHSGMDLAVIFDGNTKVTAECVQGRYKLHGKSTMICVLF